MPSFLVTSRSIRHGCRTTVLGSETSLGRTGEVLTEVIRRDDAVTLAALLEQFGRMIPPGREVHVVLDNGSSHTVRDTRTWLAAVLQCGDVRDS